MIDITELRAMLNAKNADLQRARERVKRLEDDVHTIEAMMRIVEKEVPMGERYASFSDYLSVWLRENKMTRAVLAELAGVSTVSIGNWESGKNAMSTKMKAVLANTLSKDGKTKAEDVMQLLDHFFPDSKEATA